MSGLGDWFTGLKNKISDSANTVANHVKSIVPPALSTDQGVRNSLALPSDGANTTLTGGRRRRTRNRKVRKTRRRQRKSL
jgi:hypothetical protein